MTDYDNMKCMLGHSNTDCNTYDIGIWENGYKIEFYRDDEWYNLTFYFDKFGKLVLAE